ncbi:C1q domain protein [Roseovarius aestuarii]|uniref:C1q domain protein n=2 Tax=Roseovarius aestuarii TaxID=475083 RepID=A0A1X7BPA1_9RHOB|nr:C1q domain protein [Roseovarius aestuarii]
MARAYLNKPLTGGATLTEIGKHCATGFGRAFSHRDPFMSNNLPNLNLPIIAPSQAQKHVTHNEALRILDTVTQLAVLSDTSDTPPAVSSEGERYLVPVGGQNEWAGQDGMIASHEQGAWLFYAPRPGWRIFVIDAGLLKAFDGTGWQVVGGSLLENLTGLGIGDDTASAPFTAKLNNALWTARYATDSGTGNLTQTLNKESAANDAGFILQTDFATRAVLGLLGTDKLRMSVSADGTNFLDGLVIDNTTGITDQPNLPRFSGTTNFDNFGAADSWVKIGVNALDYNDQGRFDAGTNLFTAPVDGLYQFGGHLLFKQDASNGARLNARIVRNGTTALPGSFGRNTGGHEDGATFINTLAVARLNAGDTVELQGMFSAFSGYFQADEISFWGYKIG